MAHDLTPGFCDPLDTSLSTVWGLTYINVRRAFFSLGIQPGLRRGSEVRGRRGAVLIGGPFSFDAFWRLIGHASC